MTLVAEQQALPGKTACVQVRIPDFRETEQWRQSFGLGAIWIVVSMDKYWINQRPVDLATLDNLIGRMASLDTGQSIFVSCSDETTHQQFVAVLDLCAKHAVTNFAVLSWKELEPLIPADLDVNCVRPD